MKKVIKKSPSNSDQAVARNGSNQVTPQNTPPAGIVHFQQSGPIPDPITLERYESLLPGAAERILSMAESNAHHVMDMEKDTLQAQFTIERQRHLETIIGQVFGMVTAMVSFAVAAYAIHAGLQAVAAIASGSTVIGLATVFVTGRKKGDNPPAN